MSHPPELALDCLLSWRRAWTAPGALAMGCSASLPIVPDPPARLVLYSQHAAAMDNFEAALDAVGTMKKQFDFETI